MNNQQSQNEELLNESGRKIKINIRIITTLAVVVVIIVLGFYFKPSFIAATVNGTTISRSAVVRQIGKQASKEALDLLISEKLINEEAQKKNIEITPEIVDVEIKKIESQLIAQGSTFEAAMTTQGLKMKDVEKQIIVQKKLETLLADTIATIQVSDEEVENYISSNKITFPKENQVGIKAQIKDRIFQEKLSFEARKFIDELKKNAKIKYF